MQAQPPQQETVLELEGKQGEKLSVVAYGNNTYAILKDGQSLDRSFSDLKECLGTLQQMLHMPERH